MGKTAVGAPQVEVEVSHHYVNDPNGAARIEFRPGNHTYKVWDPGYTDPNTGELKPLEGLQLGGATSVISAMDKGEGLSFYFMYEMKKFLKQFFASATIQDLMDDEQTLEQLLKEGTIAHTKKSDRGKSVGTDAHWFIERYLIELKRVQDSETPTEFVLPEIPEVEDIMLMLRKSYLTIFNNLKPQNTEQYARLPKLILADLAVQESLFTEATMLRRSTLAAKAWLEQHDIEVHGTEGTVYSRKMLKTGKYDADITVTCSYRCEWCCFNGNIVLRNQALQEADANYNAKMAAGDLSEFTYKKTMRCLTDFKSSNASTDYPKGIYPNYLAQCGVYDYALREELGIEFDAHLILNGSKDAKVDKQGNEYPVFSSHFSTNTERNRKWAYVCNVMKEMMAEGDKEIRNSL